MALLFQSSTSQCIPEQCSSTALRATSASGAFRCRACETPPARINHSETIRAPPTSNSIQKYGLSRRLSVPLGNECAETRVLTDAILRQIFFSDGHKGELALILGQWPWCGAAPHL